MTDRLRPTGSINTRLNVLDQGVRDFASRSGLQPPLRSLDHGRYLADILSPKSAIVRLRFTQAMIPPSPYGYYHWIVIDPGDESAQMVAYAIGPENPGKKGGYPHESLMLFDGLSLTEVVRGDGVKRINHQNAPAALRGRASIGYIASRIDIMAELPH